MKQNRCMNCQRQLKSFGRSYCKNCQIMIDVKEKEDPSAYETKREPKEKRNKGFPYSRTSGRKFLRGR